MSYALRGEDAPRRSLGAAGVLLILAGLLICTGAVVLFCWSLYSVTRIGTCASGGPFVSARPCPPGTGLKILGIMGAVLGGLLGIGLYSAGFARQGSAGRSALGLGGLMWSFTFLGAAASVTLAAFGPAANDDGGGAKLAAIILLVVFVPMGLFPLLAALVTRGGRGARSDAADPPAGFGLGSPMPVVPARAPVPAAAGDPVERLERLARLRESGTISDDEFQMLKAKILGS